MRQDVNNLIHRPVTGHLLALGGLLFAAYLTINRSFREFGFYYDDWRFVQLSQQSGAVPEFFAARPLHQPLSDLIFKLVGLHPITGYIIAAVLLAASVVAMYWVVNTVFPRRPAYAVLATALFVLYPGDLSRVWLSAALTGNRPAVLLALLSLGLLFTALRRRRVSRRLAAGLLNGSVAAYVASLLLYESQALLVPGLGFAGAFWIEWSGRGLAHRKVRRRAAGRAVLITLPFIVAFGSVLAWRILLLNVTGDRFVATADFSPSYIIRQFAGVYYFNFLEQPLDVIAAGVPVMAGAGLQSSGLALTAALLTVAAVHLFTQVKSRNRDVSCDNRMASDLSFYLRAAVAGLVLTGVVYAVLLPHDHIISAGGLEGPFVSRLNTAAGVVVALTIAAAIMFGWTWLRQSYPRAQWQVNTAVITPVAGAFVLLISFHGIVQRDYAEAWQLQQYYTRQIVQEAPSVASGTHFVISGAPGQHGSSYVYMYSVENMLRLVYGDESVSATVLADGSTGWEVNGEGLVRGDELIAPADRIVFLQLETAGCAAKAVPECGRFVLSGGISAGIAASGILGPDVALALTNYSRVRPGDRAPSVVDSLLGLPSGTATVASREEKPSPAGAPQFFSPGDPGEQ